MLFLDAATERGLGMAASQNREGRAAVRFPAALRVNVHRSGTGGWLSCDHEDLVTRQPN